MAYDYAARNLPPLLLLLPLLGNPWEARHRQGTDRSFHARTGQIMYRSDR